MTGRKKGKGELGDDYYTHIHIAFNITCTSGDFLDYG